MNKTLFLDAHENALRFSSFDNFNGETSFKQLAAKFVIEGSETYVIGGKKFKVHSGEYILGNNNLLSEVLIQEKTVGLCLDISNKIIDEVIQTLYDNPDFSNFLLEDKFLVNTYKAQNTSFGHRLQWLTKAVVESNRDDILMTELFYAIGENIVVDQALIFEQYARLNFKKQEVNEELFRSLLKTKSYIDDCFLDQLTLNKLLEVACMSKFAFIRLFKTTFGVSPYQYILQRRLLFSKSKLEAGCAVADVAELSGFADQAAFSKAFKKYFNVPPSKILRR